MLIAGVSEDLDGERRVAFVVGENLVCGQEYFVERVGSVGVLHGERALLHFLESNGESALVEAALDQVVDEVQSGRAGGAVVVHVVNGNSVHAHLVDGSLPAGRVAKNVA